MSEQFKIKNENGETLKAGCVVLSARNEILLVSEDKKIWSFPKGHMEQGETVEQTALREVKEETGYTVEIIERRSDATYVSGSSGELVRVALFQAKPIGEPGETDGEAYSEWFPIQNVRDLLPHNLGFIIDEIENTESL